MKILRCKNPVEKIPSNAIVTLHKINKRPKITYISNPNKMIDIIKIDADRYVNKKSGEIKEFVHSTSRKDLLNSVSQTMKNLRDLINNNFGNPEYEKYITFTYRQNDKKPMTDRKKLYDDMESFVVKARKKFGHFEYIFIVEPQGSGSLHIHALLKFNEKVDFIDNKIVEKLWGEGFVKTKAIKNSDNLGVYLSAYLTDLEYNKVNFKAIQKSGLEKCVKIIEKDVNGKSKRFLKGGRLYLYPPGINIYRCSRGIIKPEKEVGIYKDIKKKYDLKVAKYRQLNELTDDEGIFLTKQFYEDY